VTALLAVIKNRLGPVGFFTLRGLERLLSPATLYRVLKPLALLRAAFDRMEPLPDYFSKTTARTFRRARMNYFLSRLIEFFPDRLATPKWQGRFQTSGLDHILEAQKKGRPVVLVCFHFGTFKLIPFWLRALGVPVIALLGGRSEQRSRVKRMKDELSPFPEMPTVLYTGDQLRKTIGVLSAGYVLLLAADVEMGRQITVPINSHWFFRMATGAIRLASHCNAELIPCRMTDGGHWQFRLDLAAPVPREYLAQGSDMRRAAQHLLQEVLPHMQNHPEQCADYLINCFRPNASTPMAESSLV